MKPYTLQDSHSHYLGDQKKAFINRNRLLDERYYRKLRFSLLMALGAFGIWVVFLEQRPQSISSNIAMLAVVATWLCFFPSIQYLSNPQRPAIPFFPLIGIFYALSYALPIFTADNVEAYGRFSLKSITQEPLVLLILGLGMMNIAVFVSQKYLWSNISHLTLPTINKTSTLIKLAWFLLALYLCYRSVPLLNQIPSIGHLLTPLGYFSFGLFYVLWSQKKLSKSQGLWVLGFLVLELLFRLATGALAQVVLFFLFLGLVSWRQYRRLPLILLIIVTIFFLIFNPLKGEYRSLAWHGSQADRGIVDKAQIYLDLVIQHYTTSPNIVDSISQGESNEFSANINRVAQITLLSNVVKDTPARVPYWNGQTYTPLFTSFIPRILWPEKPEIRTGNDFGRRYKYLGPFDYTTSFNLPWIVEMYANFGEFGILIGMSLVGILLAFLEKKFNGNDLSDLEFLYGLTILFGLTQHLSNFALEVGGTLMLALSLYILLKLSKALLEERQG